MVTSMVAGLVLNWTADFAALAVLALVSDLIAVFVTPTTWLAAAAVVGMLTAYAVLAYGIAFRLEKGVELTGKTWLG